MSYFNNNRRGRGEGEREGGTSASGFWNLMVSMCTYGSKMSVLGVSAALHCVCPDVYIWSSLPYMDSLAGKLLLSLPPGCWGSMHKLSHWFSFLGSRDLNWRLHACKGVTLLTE